MSNQHHVQSFLITEPYDANYDKNRKTLDRKQSPLIYSPVASPEHCIHILPGFDPHGNDKPKRLELISLTSVLVYFFRLLFLPSVYFRLSGSNLLLHTSVSIF